MAYDDDGGRDRHHPPIAWPFAEAGTAVLDSRHRDPPRAGVGAAGCGPLVAIVFVAAGAAFA